MELAEIHVLAAQRAHSDMKNTFYSWRNFCDKSAVCEHPPKGRSLSCINTHSPYSHPEPRPIIDIRFFHNASFPMIAARELLSAAFIHFCSLFDYIGFYLHAALPFISQHKPHSPGGFQSNFSCKFMFTNIIISTSKLYGVQQISDGPRVKRLRFEYKLTAGRGAFTHGRFCRSKLLSFIWMGMFQWQKFLQLNLWYI